MEHQPAQGCCLPKDLAQIWDAAYQHADQDERVTQDIARANGLDVTKVTSSDFLRECAWAIFGARYPFSALEKRWPDLQQVFLRWNVREVVAQAPEVEQQAVQIIGYRRKVKGVLANAARINTEGWPTVRSTLLRLLLRDEVGNPMESPELITYLDSFRWIGPTLASYIAKNLGVGSIKDDRWMLRLAKWLGYQPDKSGVWDMARDFQSLRGEKINVIDTVLWNWASVPQECLRKVSV